MDKSDAKQRKVAKRAWRQQQRAKARAALPLPPPLLVEMFDMLDKQSGVQSCDHTLRLVRTWADKKGVDFDRLEAWLNANGGYCDCEALANAEEVFEDAIVEPSVNGSPS